MAGGGRILNDRTNHVTSKAQTPSVEQPVDESQFEQTGNLFADYVLDRLAQYAETRKIVTLDGNQLYVISEYGEDSMLKGFESVFRDWVDEGTSAEKATKKAVCERILVEKMKKKEFFYCAYCDTVLYNHKQALIHFTRPHHHDTVQADYDAAIAEYVERNGLRTRRVSNISKCGLDTLLDLAGALHERLAAEDTNAENDRRKRFGRVNRTQPHKLQPDAEFLTRLSLKYCCQGIPASASDIAEPTSARRARLSARDSSEGERDAPQEPREDATAAALVLTMQGELGRRIMADLDERLAREKMTWCYYCGLKTGNREGLYAHYTSYAHLKKLEEGGPEGRVPIRNEIQTAAVNVQRRDLIDRKK